MVQQTSTLYLSKSALEKNLKFIRRVIGKGTKLSCVVKGNAYGHGFSSYIPLAESLGVDHFSVFSDYEAEQVQKASTKNATIMIMGMIQNKNISWAIRNDIEFFVFEMDRLRKAVSAAKRLKKKAKIHIELETGMNRTGFLSSEMDSLISYLQKNEQHISIEGLCTHYAGAEGISNYYRIHKQIKNFHKLSTLFSSHGVDIKCRHTACSAATIAYPKTRMDMVRIGIMQYGFWPSDETHILYMTQRKKKRNPLVPILSWKSTIMSVKDVPAGEFIGYGDGFLTNEKTKIAIVPVGYTNGYSRLLSNKSSILVRGRRVNVIGMVNMNLAIINISQVPEVQKGDEVVLVGEQGDHMISFASFREQKNALNYEVLARLPQNISRKIIE